MSEVGSEAEGENSKIDFAEKAGVYGGELESTDVNEKLDGIGVGGLKTDRSVYDFLYGYFIISFMFFNLLANTSEVY